MAIPEQHQIEDKLFRLRCLVLPNREVVGLDGKPVDVPLDELERRLLHHLDLERSHPSWPDGYPTKASGAAASAGGASTSGAEDPEERVDLTGPERTFLAQQKWKDAHHSLTEKATGYLFDAVHAIAALGQTLNKLESVGAPSDVVDANDDRWCRNHARHGVPHEPRGLDGSPNCRWCDDIKRNPAFGQLPGPKLIDYAARHGNRSIPDSILRLQFPNYRVQDKRAC